MESMNWSTATKKDLYCEKIMTTKSDFMKSELVKAM